MKTKNKKEKRGKIKEKEAILFIKDKLGIQLIDVNLNKEILLKNMRKIEI